MGEGAFHRYPMLARGFPVEKSVRKTRRWGIGEMRLSKCMTLKAHKGRHQEMQWQKA